MYDDYKEGYFGSIQGSLSKKITTTKEFLTDNEKWFIKNKKDEIGVLLTSIISMKYIDKGIITKYIMKMFYMASKLGVLNLELSKDLPVYLVLVSLPIQFSQFKVSYNYQKETWSLNELILYYIEDKYILKKDKVESAHLASTYKDKGKRHKRKKDKETANTEP